MGSDMNSDLETTKTVPQENNKYSKRWSFSTLPYRVTPFPPSGINTTEIILLKLHHTDFTLLLSSRIKQFCIFLMLLSPLCTCFFPGSVLGRLFNICSYYPQLLALALLILLTHIRELGKCYVPCYWSKYADFLYEQQNGRYHKSGVGCFEAEKE